MNTTMTLASAAAFSLLHSLWELALLALLAAGHLAGLRSASAGTRHAMGMGWLLAMLAAPVLTFAWYWHSMAPAAATGPAWFGSAAHPEDLDVAPASLVSSTLGSWLLVCMAQVWLLGVALMALRQLGGWRALRRIEHAPSVPLPPEWLARFEVLRRAMGISRSVRVCMAQRIVSPFTAHVLRPLVWLPLSLLTQLPRDQVEALLAHELAHIRRLDWCWNTIQCAIESVLFHHPAMWWLSRRVREEREHACDDLAVAVCGDAVVLAEALAGLQRRGAIDTDTPRLVLAAQGGFLMRRITHLLSTTPNRPNWRWPAVLLLLLCSGTLLATQVMPPASILTNLRSDVSSQGELTPGNYREFTATYLGSQQRHYRIDMNAEGQVHEVYLEGGRDRPIDESVRAWLKTVYLMSDSKPPLLALPPPPPPRPPLPPHPTESAEFGALMAQLETDPQVVARTGRPVQVDRKSFHGSVHVWGASDFHLWGVDDAVGGKAAFTVTFTGPDGRVDVTWSGKTLGGTWKADSMALAPPAR